MPGLNTASARAVTSRAVEIIRFLVDTDSRYPSARDIAKALGISEVVVSKWVTGVSNITTSDLVNFCNRFRANPMYLVLGMGEPLLSKTFRAEDPHDALLSRIKEAEFMVDKLKRDALSTRNKKPEQPVKNSTFSKPKYKKVS